MGSDGTIVATYNPFHTIWEYTAGKIFPDIVKYQPDEVITREEALIAHTRSNAHILFMEDRIGTLEAGFEIKAAAILHLYSTFSG